MSGANCFAEIVKSKAVINLLQEEISAVKRFLDILLQKFGRRVTYDNFLLFFIFLAVEFIHVFLGPYIRISPPGFCTDLF